MKNWKKKQSFKNFFSALKITEVIEVNLSINLSEMYLGQSLHLKLLLTRWQFWNVFVSIIFLLHRMYICMQRENRHTEPLGMLGFWKLLCRQRILLTYFGTYFYARRVSKVSVFSYCQREKINRKPMFSYYSRWDCKKLYRD